MSDKKISQLTASTTPLAGTEVLPIVQGGVTKQVSVANLTAGRTVAASRVDTSNTASGGVMATFTSGWSNTLVTLKGDGATGAGVMNISNAAASASLPYQLQLNGTKVLGSDINGNIDVSVGNLVIGTAGKGIDFSADPSAAGMTSELLDDYEEGDWTPTLAFGGASTGIVYASSFMGGKYTKIGNRVFAHGTLILSDKGSATGAAAIGGLPFASSNNAANYPAISLAIRNVTFVGQFQALQIANTSTISLYEVTEAGSVTDLTNADFANGTELQFSLNYIV